MRNTCDEAIHTRQIALCIEAEDHKRLVVHIGRTIEILKTLEFEGILEQQNKKD